MANKMAVEKDIVKWISCLLNSVHDPDLVILFGLTSIMRDAEIRSWWNDERGLYVDWERPRERQFRGYSKKSLLYREWQVQNARRHRMRIVIWPNHPSRAPFTDFDTWKLSVREYLEIDSECRHHAAAVPPKARKRSIHTPSVAAVTGKIFQTCRGKNTMAMNSHLRKGEPVSADYVSERTGIPLPRVKQHLATKRNRLVLRNGRASSKEEVMRHVPSAFKLSNCSLAQSSFG